MAPMNIKESFLKMNRLVGHSSTKNHMSSIRLGDTDALAKDTKEKQIRKVYDKRAHHDAVEDDVASSRERKQAVARSAPGNDSPSVRSRDGERERHEGDVDELPTTALRSLGEDHVGNPVTITGRLHHSRAMSSKLAFIIVRQQIHSIQGVLEQGEGEISEDFVRWALKLAPETVIRVEGRLRRAPERIQTCSIHDFELVVEKLHVLVPVEQSLPMDVYNMDKAERDEDTGELHLLASNRVRVNNRIIFIRTPVMQSVLRIRSAICSLFRSTLENKGFIEIQTPKLQPAATESGAEVFKVDYFGRTAFLAQSPQLAKQMAISSDLDRVFEIGPVFRAENSNTHRHLTEYTGLDLEMAIEKDYHEAMDVIDDLLKSILKGIYEKHRREIEEVKTKFPHEDLVWLDQTPRLTFKDGIRLLNDSGWKDDEGNPAAENEDLSTRAEIRLGQVVKEKYKTDYYILDKFPTSARPFYTRLDKDDEAVTNSFDIFIRGQEVTTGGERINQPGLLRDRMKKADISPESMAEYMQAFTSGAPPHAGCGIGLERVLFLLLGLGDIRNASIFPRDPKSLPATRPSAHTDVPFSDADTIRYALDRNNTSDTQGSEGVRPLPDIGRLIANYGDATNTSWLDDTYTLWRHEPTGAAVGYAEHNGYAFVMGNPLCDSLQYPQVVSAFLDHLVKGKKSKDRLRPIWLLVSPDVEALLARQLRWRTLSVVAEQRLHVENAKPVAKKERQAKNADLRVHDTRLGELPPGEVRDRCDARIEDWKENRKGRKQVHITAVRPWVQPDHRRYVWATDSTGTPQGLVVLHRLAPRHGYQIKFALDFPGSPSGTIEMVISHALQVLMTSGVKDVTFGAGATDEVEFGRSLDHTIRAKIIRRSYKAVMKELHLIAKNEFREKFGAEEDRVYICYPPLGLGVSGARTLVQFFEEEM